MIMSSYACEVHLMFVIALYDTHGGIDAREAVLADPRGARLG
jgi:hypothetical protein